MLQWKTGGGIWNVVGTTWKINIAVLHLFLELITLYIFFLVSFE